jgi:lipid II:glycine glycyltransferase (peptidoglycan interpeptide bridge formation enzyme)
MIIKELPISVDPSIVNNVVSHPLQSYQWGQARQKMGVMTIRIGIFEEISNVLKDVITVTVHNIPHTKYHIGYIPRSKAPSSYLITYLKSLKKELNLIFVKFEPDEVFGSEIDKELTKSRHPLFPNWTQTLSLLNSKEEILKKMKPKTRYNIKIAQKNNVTVSEESNDLGYLIFQKLYFETVKRQTYHGHGELYHKKVWDNMKNGIAHIMIAKYKDEPLSAYELFLFKDKLYYPYGGSSLSHKNLMASNLLMWEAILFGKKNGATEFDMWGSLPPNYNKNKEWAGFTKFKEGYGTNFKQFVGSFDLILNPVAYNIYNTAYFLRDILLRSRVL